MQRTRRSIIPGPSEGNNFCPTMTTIPAQFEQTLSVAPDKGAVFSGSKSLTFRQLHAEAAAAAQALAQLGVGPGDRVGVCMQKTLDQVVALLGVLWANAILVPIHPVLRAEQIARVEGEDRSFVVPVVADAEAGFGGPLNAYELTAALIAAGAAGVHFEDQLASEKKCGHLGGKVLVPTGQFIRTLQAARLAADVAGVPTLLALAATLLTSDVDERDRPFVTGERTAEGYFRVRAGLDAPIARALAYAPYADLVWCETSTPDLGQARAFAEAVHDRFPGKLLAYNCSPSFNWRRQLDDQTIARFQKELAAMGYRFQFITLAGFHSLNAGAFELAAGYAAEGMPAYVRLQQHELAMEAGGYTATRHQREVGTGVFDLIAQAVTAGQASTLALADSTEQHQF